jgi:hypothetical protein
MKKNCLLLICFGAAFNIIAAENTTAELISLKEKGVDLIKRQKQTN